MMSTFSLIIIVPVHNGMKRIHIEREKQRIEHENSFRILEDPLEEVDYQRFLKEKRKKSEKNVKKLQSIE